MSTTSTKKERKKSPKAHIREIISRFPTEKVPELEQCIVQFCKDNKLEECLEASEKTLLQQVLKGRNVNMKVDELTNAQATIMLKLVEKGELAAIKKKPSKIIKSIVKKFEEEEEPTEN